MYVCICNGVNESEIKNTMERLYKYHEKIDLELLKHYTNTGNSCGCCLNYLKDIIEDFQQSKEKDIVSLNKR